MRNNGVSLISLIVTIVVIIILASITVFNSFDVLEDSHLTKMEKEYNDVCTFVTNISTKAQADLIDLKLTAETIASTSEIEKFCIDSETSEFTNYDATKIDLINKTEGLDSKYCYHYITGNQIENGIPGINEDAKLDKVENDYIINFYYGVVIAKVSETKTNVVGVIR